MRALVLALLVACAPCPCEGPQERDAEPPVRAPVLPPLEPDGTYAPPLPPCSRVSVFTYDGGAWVIPLPCRPYDRARDLADPQP